MFEEYKNPENHERQGVGGREKRKERKGAETRGELM